MKLYTGGHLTFYLPERTHTLEILLKKPAPLREILEQVGIPPAEVALVVVNGKLVEVETAIVSDSDEVRVFSAINGG